MAKTSQLKARLPRGLADRSAADIRASERMLATIRRVYERYGFEPVETPFIEYTDALGKFLPDQDRPNEGVFSFQDDDPQEARSAGGATGKHGEWLSLRYDLTAPLARYVAENYERLPKPYRSYRAGWVFRNEKPGPGRFRQFMQFDADTVGSASPAADAEMCMMAADALEALGIPRGQYVIKVNSRKVLDGVMEAIGLAGDENAGRRLTVVRAIDKLDRLGIDGVRELLGPGRKDESGDFTKGAGLDPEQVNVVLAILEADVSHNPSAAIRPRDDPALAGVKGGILFPIPAAISNSERFSSILFDGAVNQGINELDAIRFICEAAGYGADRILVSFSVVRGLEYYTGPVFEAELLSQIPNEQGQPVVFGSVGGGGRYDGLVGRFMGENVPATGFSIGVSRLQAALTALGKLGDKGAAGPVVVLVMKDQPVADAQRFVSALRNADVPAEIYLGSAGMKAQMKYADRRGAPLVVIQGGDEKARGVVQIKDMRAGKEASASIADNAQWREQRAGQEEVTEAGLVEAVNRLLGRGERRP